MENVVFNKCQTPLEELHLDKYPQEVQEKKNYTVYRHISPSGKVYVGITKLSLSFRWNQGRGYKRCKLFYRAIQKYGWDNFTHEVLLDKITKSEAIYVERYLIKWYKLHSISYNITDGGESTTGFHMPEDARKRISQYLKENRGRPVLQYTIEGEFIREFKSATAAADILGYGHTSVINCASGNKRENLLYGSIFIYKDEVDKLPQRLEWCKNHWKTFKIVQYQNGVILNTFDSIREAERVTGVNRVCIRKNIQGKFKRAGEYTWKKIKKEKLYGN